MSFEEMGLNEKLLRGIYNYGFEIPSDIQEKSIKKILSGKDIIIQASSGMGKTGTFVISMLQMINNKSDDLQGMIIVPTRELAIQIHTILLEIGKYIENVSSMLCIGGVKSILKKSQIVIGTPGKIYDLLSKKELDSSELKMFVLDEADEMLSRGFIEQIKEIYGLLEGEHIQNVVLSATMSPEIIEITENFMDKDSIKILLKRENLTLEGIKQYYINIDKEEWKLPTLYDLYDSISVKQTIIFINSKKKLEWVFSKMKEKDYPVTMISGDLPQNERTEILKNFKNGTIRMLLSTDLFARGIDVQQVSLVINYDLPNSIENYIHRIGRAGRYKKTGISINFITTDTIELHKEIEKYYITHIDELPGDLSKVLT